VPSAGASGLAEVSSRMIGPRREREEQFVRQDHWGHYALSYDLTFCADRMLAAALQERSEQVYRLAKTHYTSFAIGAIALIATAFDSFLNEVCDFQKKRELVAKTTTVERLIELLPPGTALQSARSSSCTRR